jgi:predicted nucleotidyltransferase
MVDDMNALADLLRPAFQATRGVAAAWVFGSVARGVARPDSDLDIAVLLRDRSATAETERKTLLRLAAELERATGRPVDLVILSLRDPIIAHRVLVDGALVHDEDVVRRVDFISDVLSRYLDWAPSYERTAADSLATNRAWARAASR